MEKATLRLELLKLTHNGGKPVEESIERARRYEQFVLGQEPPAVKPSSTGEGKPETGKADNSIFT